MCRVAACLTGESFSQCYEARSTNLLASRRIEESKDFLDDCRTPQQVGPSNLIREKGFVKSLRTIFYFLKIGVLQTMVL